VLTSAPEIRINDTNSLLAIDISDFYGKFKGFIAGLSCHAQELDDSQKAKLFTQGGTVWMNLK
jgi:hypothetical protein